MPSRSIHTLALVAACACACACASVELTPARIVARRGPAFDRTPHRVVALPATCGSLSMLEAGSGFGPDAGPELAVEEGTRSIERQGVASRPPTAGLLWSECKTPELVGVDMSVRASLEFLGLDVVDSERLNATTFAHQVIEQTTRTGDSVVSSRSSERRGATFADAPPALQGAILGELGADGVVSTRIWIGAGVGPSMRRSVEVQVRMLEVGSGQLVWAKRCTEEIGGFTSDAAAMERGARCAAVGVEAR